MAARSNQKDEGLKPPSVGPAEGGAGERTTPYSGGEATTDWNLTAPTRQALAQRYDLLEEVGRGGMGIVYRARDRETGDTVALKVLKPEIASRVDLIERFKTELLLARKITHKNVCRTYELLRFGETVAIAMEYVEGESLRAILERFGGVPLRRGLEWTSQVCSGLAEAHSQGVVHRDLKPENIVIDRKGQAKIMDFGIARSVERDATKTGTLIGTPAYMSPEQVEGKPADARSDLYSLGLILYEMFTGRRALDADTPVALALKQIQETPLPPRQIDPDLPERLDHAIQKCLEKSPKKRFQAVAELEAALSKKPEARPVVAPDEEVALPLHLTRWQRSDWLLVGAAVAGLALFFPFFERTSLAPRSQVHFDRSILRRIAQEYAQRIGTPLSQEYRIDSGPLPNRYDYVAERAGALAALELTSTPVPYWAWGVEWHYNDRRPTEVWVDNRGSLISFNRDFPAGSGTDRMPVEEAKPLAEKALADFFNRKPSELRLESAATDAWWGLPTTSFIWADPKDYHGLPQRYIVRFVGREIAALDVSHDPPGGYVWRPPLWQMLPMLALLLVWLALGLYQRRQVDLAARWRLVTVALGFVLGSWMSRQAKPIIGGDVPILHIFVSISIGLAVALLIFFATIVVERSVRRIAPSKFSSFIRFFDRRALSEPCGLAIVRGTFLGLALLGLDNSLVWLGTRYLGMRLDSMSQIVFQGWPFLRSPGVSGHLVLDLLNQTLGVGMLIGFLASFLAGVVRRSWVAGFAAAAVAAAILHHPLISLGSVQPYHGKVLLLLFDCLLLIWAFTRFDLLTLMAAVFTFAFWWQNYRLLIMFQPTGSGEQWLAFAVWGLLVVAAAAIAFQSTLGAARGRLAAVFE